jgi:hypothetical protein
MFSVVHFKITDRERQTLVVKSGDVLEMEIFGVGTLRNPAAAGSFAAWPLKPNEFLDARQHPLPHRIGVRAGIDHDRICRQYFLVALVTSHLKIQEGLLERNARREVRPGLPLAERNARFPHP